MLCAQSPALTFDVASVKPVPASSGDYRANLGSALHGEVTLTNATFSECLRFAWDINNDYQIGGPDWIKSRQYRFNIVAKSAPETPLPQLRLMLQSLLAERFRLALHHEQKELPYLALAAAPKGVKINAAREGSDPAGNRYILGVIRSNRITITELTLLLSRFLRQPVLDQTGLHGFYELKLEWTPDRPAGTPASAEAPEGPTIYEAVQAQLGLKLE